MKTLIVEDDFTSRILLQEMLQPYGEIHIAVNGREAVEAVRYAMELQEPYVLVCLDVMMPEMDGLTALKKIRDLEGQKRISSSNNVKIIMTTALNDLKDVTAAYHELCDGYLVKPLGRSKLVEQLRTLALIPG
jgi:two-component system chemotaxis response regulator CheY